MRHWQCDGRTKSHTGTAYFMWHFGNIFTWHLRLRNMQPNDRRTWGHANQLINVIFIHQRFLLGFLQSLLRIISIANSTIRLTIAFQPASKSVNLISVCKWLACLLFKMCRELWFAVWLWFSIMQEVSRQSFIWKYQLWNEPAGSNGNCHCFESNVQLWTCNEEKRARECTTTANFAITPAKP